MIYYDALARKFPTCLFIYKNYLFTSLHYNQPDMPAAEVILYDMRNGLYLLFICPPSSQLNEDVFFIKLFDSVMSRFDINEH